VKGRRETESRCNYKAAPHGVGTLKRVDDRPLLPRNRITRRVLGYCAPCPKTRTNKLDATTAKRDRLVRIFVVDDSATARAALKSALEGRADWVVVGEAVDGHHALATFHLHTPHLTLMEDARQFRILGVTPLACFGSMLKIFAEIDFSDCSRSEEIVVSG
jgi:hypothetical protein